MIMKVLLSITMALLATVQAFCAITPLTPDNVYTGGAGFTSESFRYIDSYNLYIIAKHHNSDAVKPITNSVASIPYVDALNRSLIAATCAYGVVRGTNATLGNTNGTYLITTVDGLVTLPNAVGIEGRTYTIKCVSPSTSATLTNAIGTQLIDGTNIFSLTSSNKFVTVQSDGANWWIIGNN
jgi:hypothetical protein